METAHRVTGSPLQSPQIAALCNRGLVRGEFSVRARRTTAREGRCSLASTSEFLLQGWDLPCVYASIHPHTVYKTSESSVSTFVGHQDGDRPADGQSQPRVSAKDTERGESECSEGLKDATSSLPEPLCMVPRWILC